MSDFWERQRAKAAQQRAQRPTDGSERRQNAPWWAQGTSLISGQGPAPQSPQNPSQSLTGLEGRDFSKAAHLKNESFCPECGSGDYFKASASVARRCYQCGFVDGRSIHDVGLMGTPIMEGPARMARQTNSGGKNVNNYRGNITTASEAVARIG